MIRLSSHSKVFARATCSVGSQVRLPANTSAGACLEEALTRRALLELAQRIRARRSCSYDSFSIRPSTASSRLIEPLLAGGRSSERIYR